MMSFHGNQQLMKSSAMIDTSLKILGLTYVIFHIEQVLLCDKDSKVPENFELLRKFIFFCFADVNLLRKATVDLQTGFSYLSDFVPSRAIVVTWSGVTFDGANSSLMVSTNFAYLNRVVTLNIA